MKHDWMKKDIIALTAAAALWTCSPASGGPLSGPETPKAQPSPASSTVEQTKQEPPKKALGPVADTIQPYRPAGRDPFKMTIVKLPSVAKAKAPKPIGFPTFDVRRAEYRRLVAQNEAKGLPAPDPTRQYLVSELSILGVFSDQRGPGAFVRAQTTGTTFFVRQGSKCYNGEILRIESDPSDLSGARVVFKELSFLDVNGKQTQQERVVAKTAGAQGK